LPVQSASSPQFRAASPAAPRGFRAYAWSVVGITLAVILWGAYVRAAGAGNGCGDNWPLCGGQFFPSHPKLTTLIEFAHRASSGVDALLALFLFLAALHFFPRRHRVRRAAGWGLIFMGMEALLGAALVLFGWVGQNASAGRVIADAVHLGNTMLLLGAITLAAVWASGLAPPRRPVRGEGWRLGAGLGAVIVTAAFGTMAALADTLYPVRSLAAGLRQDIHAQALLPRLRVLHPAIAILTGLYLLYLVFDAHPAGASRLTRRLGIAVAAAVGVQWACGALDVALTAPAGMQLLHLATADLLWLTLVAYVAARVAAAPPDPALGMA
jgi:cytochrome c oxidase assembly protein subunit 15